MKRVGLYIEGEICTGCNACQIACKDAHDLPLGVNLLRIHAGETGENGQITVRFRPEGCRHCKNAPCAGACSRGALFLRDDGTMGYRGDLCDGCGSCREACAFGQIYLSGTEPGIYRCDGCYERRLGGGEPVCVLACPVNCLHFSAPAEGEEVCG